MGKITVSVVGTSWITEAFLSGVRRVEGLITDGVCSRNAEKGNAFAEKQDARRVFTTLDALCASDTDSVYVASPNAAHFEQCKTLLLSGKHVICEKPIVVSLNEYDTLVNIADKNNLVFIEAIMYMHTPVRQAFKDAAKKIGTVYAANIDYSQLSSKYPALLRGENPNIFNPALKAGALNDLGVYCVYPALDLFGIPDDIRGVRRNVYTGADGCGSAVFLYSDKLVTITYSKVGQSRGVSQIIGDKGTLSAESISQLTGVSLYDNEGNKTVLCAEKTKAELMGYEAQSFYDFIAEPDKNKARLCECVRLAGEVVTAMEKMRL